MGKAKNKTHKATVKRFKISASGKLRHSKQMDNAHLKVNKSKRQLNRQEGIATLVSKKEVSKLMRMMLK